MLLFSEPYLYQSVRLLECSDILQSNNNNNNNYYVIIKTGQSDSSGNYFKVREIKQCCHFLINKCKIFKLLIKLLFLRLFEPDQSEIKEIFYEIVNLHNLGDF